MNKKETHIPLKGRSRKEVLKQLKSFNRDDPDYKHSKLWSLVYYLGKEHTDFLHEAYGSFFSANGLNPMAFKSLKKFEEEVIDMTVNLLNGDKNCSGVMTSCGMGATRRMPRSIWTPRSSVVEAR